MTRSGSGFAGAGGERGVGGKAYCSYLPCGVCSRSVYFMNLLLSILVSYSVTELTYSVFALDER